MVKRWMGKAYHLKDGDDVVVRGVSMGSLVHGRVNLTLDSAYARGEPLYLTTVELEMNLAEGQAT